MRHGAIRAAALALCSSLLSSGARANDTMVAFGAGGLQFEKTDKLRMEREDLYLSPREVRVSYVFRNPTDRDVRGRVAFPMPEIKVGQMSETRHKFHRSDRDGDIFDFRVEVDGRPVAAGFDARAYVRSNDGTEKDITDLLKKHRVGLLGGGVMTSKPAPELYEAGAFERIQGNDEFPVWTLRPAYHWSQLFPARKETRITHRYKPVLGSSAMYAVDEIKIDDITETGTGEYCQDQAFWRALKKLPAEPINNALLTTWLEYILKTGANWAGPIGKFRLEIGKGGADLVSLCPIPGLNLQRRGQSFVAEATNYVPTTDIKLLFVHRACDKAPCSNVDWPGYPR